MALIRRMSRHHLEHGLGHSEAMATYSIVVDRDGNRLLQIDTYGSASRELRGKKSQSLRFSTEAMAQLREILDAELASGEER